MSRTRLRPSAGFVLLIFSYSLLAVTLAWGFSTPELERIWALTQSMQRREFVGLTLKDVQLLKTALSHYPTLSRAFIGRAPLGFVEPTRDGWTSTPSPHIIANVPSAGPVNLQIECQSPPNSFPVTVIFERERERRELRFDENSRKDMEFHFSSPAKPELIPVMISQGVSTPNQQAKIKITLHEHLGTQGSP